MKYTPPTQGSIVAEEGEHVVMTGTHMKGTVTLPGGEQVDVTDEFVVARDAVHAAEIAHAIGQHWAAEENVHPAQIDVAEDGTVTVNPFVYDDSGYHAALEAAGVTDSTSTDEEA